MVDTRRTHQSGQSLLQMVTGVSAGVGKSGPERRGSRSPPDVGEHMVAGPPPHSPLAPPVQLLGCSPPWAASHHCSCGPQAPHPTLSICCPISSVCTPHVFEPPGGAHSRCSTDACGGDLCSGGLGLEGGPSPCGCWCGVDCRGLCIWGPGCQGETGQWT